jgi:precorrin-3B synthase
VVDLHHAEDGLLARVRTPGGRLSAGQLRALARCARMGNGLVDLTSRANVQIRGLRDEHREPLVSGLQAVGLLPSMAHDRARNIIAPPTGEFDAIVEALDAAICADPALAGLGGRFLFAVGIEHPAASVTLLPAPDGAPLAEAVAAAVGGAGRVAFAARLARPVPTDLVTALAPLGRLDAAALDGLADLAPVWVGLDRTVTARGVGPSALEALGLVTDPDSGWAGLTACAGLACPRGRVDVRAEAARRARRRGPGSSPLHLAACERRCGAVPGRAVEVLA